MKRTNYGIWTFPAALVILLLSGCTAEEPVPPSDPQAPGEPAAGGFEDDLRFLEQHVDLFTVGRGESRIAVVPAWQGRVMTSTNEAGGLSFGWINYELVESGIVQPRINVFGGEDRFWLGPEGGQFGIFFSAGDPFDLTHWQTPSVLDTEPFELVSRDETSADFRKETQVENYRGFLFNVGIERNVSVFSRAEIEQKLGLDLPAGVREVGFQSRNQIRNLGERSWTRESGLLSIWILGMFVPSSETTVILPYEEGPEEELGPIVNDDYFGQVPDERLKVADGDGKIFFLGDGQYRSKIGLSPSRAGEILGSWDGTREVLTIVTYTRPEGATDYVNSLWELQDDPYGGDVVNSYNDGPPSPGEAPLGPFYELETSSPAAQLNPGEALVHEHRTFHFTGPREELDRMSLQLLGASLEELPW